MHRNAFGDPPPPPLWGYVTWKNNLLNLLEKKLKLFFAKQLVYNMLAQNVYKDTVNLKNVSFIQKHI